MSAGNTKTNLKVDFRRVCAGLLTGLTLSIAAPAVCRAEVAPELTTAIRTHNVKAAVRILSEGADVNERDESLEQTPLMWAAQSGDAGMVLTLLAHGATVNAQDDSGQTALMLAAEKGQPRVVKVLLDNGANVALRDAQGRTALTLARAKAANAPVARLLAQTASGSRSGATPDLRVAHTTLRNRVVASR